MSTSGLVAAILNSGCRLTSARVDIPIAESGVVDNVGVAGAISFVAVLQRYLVFALIAKHFRFSGRHIGFLEGDEIWPESAVLYANHIQKKSQRRIR